jgi:hypothetical protein
VTRESPTAIRFTVRQFPDTTQVTLWSQEEAVQLACRFARSHGLNVWYGEGIALHLVEMHRARTVRPRAATPKPVS